MFRTALTTCSTAQHFSKGRLEVKGENVKISVKPEASSLVEIKIIDGRKCLVIPMDSDMEVNGIIKKITAKLEEEKQ